MEDPASFVLFVTIRLMPLVTQRGPPLAQLRAAWTLNLLPPGIRVQRGCLLSRPGAGRRR